MNRPVFTNPDSPVIKIEPKTKEEFIQVLKDCKAYNTGHNSTAENMQAIAILRYSQRESGHLKGQTYHEATAGLTLFDIDQEDYDYFKTH